MRLFNAQTGKVELFQPDEKKAILAMCGTTPEDALHLEQAYPYCVADTFVRYLKMKGCRVNNSSDKNWRALENSYSRHVIEELKLLNVRPLDNLPQAVESIHHANGVDLLFLQHDYDNAINQQIEKRPFARFWFCTAEVKYQGQKKDQSQNKPILIQNLLKRFSADTIRLYFAQQHYRRSWMYDEVALKRASQYVGKLKAAMNAVSTGDLPINLKPVQRRFMIAMNNDFDTLKGIASLLNLADEILFRAPIGYSIDEAQVVLRYLACLFGLRLNNDMGDQQAITS